MNKTEPLKQLLKQGYGRVDVVDRKLLKILVHSVKTLPLPGNDFPGVKYPDRNYNS